MDEDALANYRKGQEHENRVKREDNEIAVEAYKKAIELDPRWQRLGSLGPLGSIPT